MLAKKSVSTESLSFSFSCQSLFLVVQRELRTVSNSLRHSLSLRLSFSGQIINY